MRPLFLSRPHFLGTKKSKNYFTGVKPHCIVVHAIAKKSKAFFNFALKKNILIETNITQFRLFWPGAFL